MPEATKVLYETDDAIKNLDKLDRKVRKSGNTAKKSFKGAGSGAASFGKQLISLDGRAAGFAGTLTQVGGALTALNPAFVAVAGAVVATTAAFIDWGEAGRKAIQNIEAAAQIAKRNIESIDVLSAQETNEATRGLKQELRDIAATSATRRIDDARIKQEQATLQTQILQRKTALDQIVEEEKNAAKKIADIRDRALAGSGATGAQLNKQIQDILDRASKVGRGGDVQRQQKLLNDARKLSQDAERPDFFLQRILQQERGIASGPDKGGGDQQLSKRKKALQDEIKLLERRNKALSIASQTILAAQKADRGRATQLREEVKRIEAESNIADAIARQTENLQAGNRILRTRLGLSEQVLENFRTGASIVFGEGVRETGRQRQLVDESFKAGQQGIAAAESGDIEGLKQALIEIDKRQNAIADAKSKNDFTAAYEERIKGVEKLREAIVAAIREQANLDAARGDITTTRAAELNQQRQQQAPAAPGRGDQASTNITINANIKGGAFDADTLKKFTEITKREVRKATQETA